MAIPGPYSGASTLALVARTTAFANGVVYESIKLSILKVRGVRALTCHRASTIGSRGTRMLMAHPQQLQEQKQQRQRQKQSAIDDLDSFLGPQENRATMDPSEMERRRDNMIVVFKEKLADPNTSDTMMEMAKPDLEAFKVIREYEDRATMDPSEMERRLVVFKEKLADPNTSDTMMEMAKPNLFKVIREYEEKYGIKIKLYA